jgi:putative oxidoreductase
MASSLFLIVMPQSIVGASERMLRRIGQDMAAARPMRASCRGAQVYGDPGPKSTPTPPAMTCYKAARLHSSLEENMAGGSSSWRGLAPHFLSLLRVMTGLLFLQHGTAKILGFPPSDFGGQPLMSMTGFSGMLELVGGALIVVGLFTRPVAFIFSGMMAVAYFMVHAPQNFYPLLNGGELAALYCFVFLYLSAAGGGPWSLDRAIRRVG